LTVAAWLSANSGARAQNLDVKGTTTGEGPSFFATMSGNVGVGTLSPATKLHVNGFLSTSGPFTGTWDAGYLRWSNNEDSTFWQTSYRGTLDTSGQRNLSTYYYN